VQQILVAAKVQNARHQLKKGAKNKKGFEYSNLGVNSFVV
tara:strand:+ start:5720 stop:5839 length:120 start_codon:yes stop_codon:yes gene_type:complete